MMKIILEFSKNVTIEINVSGVYNRINKNWKNVLPMNLTGQKEEEQFMRKKAGTLTAVLLTAAMTFGLLAGCQTGGTDSGENKGGEKTESGKDSGKTKIAFIPQLVGIPYFSAMEKGGERAAEDLGVDYLYTGATQANAAEQVKIMDSLIKQGVDAISLSVLDSSSTNPYIEKAQEAGIHVYTSDSDAPDSTREFYVAQASDEDLGRTLMDRLAEQIGEKGKIGIVSGESTATNLNSWISWIEKQQEEKYPDIDVELQMGGQPIYYYIVSVE